MREPILLTPGPLSTAPATKTAMLADWGSWDPAFNEITARVCKNLLDIVNGQGRHTCVPLQGSGTFAVEAALGSLVPREGKLLVLVNGAYGKRMARIAEVLGRAVLIQEGADNAQVNVAQLTATLAADPAITHVGLIHCETSTGILNPLEEVAKVVAAAERRLIVDAMSSFGALPIDSRQIRFEALIASANKCLEGVPGMGFVIVEQEALARSAGNSHSLALDLSEQYLYMQKTGQWRFTPPTHVVAALDAALTSYLAEGGQSGRLARYSSNCAVLTEGLTGLGLKLYLGPEIQAPIILTVHAPASPDYDFANFYRRVRELGFILYPGKLTDCETFRVGCIGAIDRTEILQAVSAIERVLKEQNLLA